MTSLRIFNNHIKVCLIVLAVAESLAFFEAVYIAYAIRFQTLDFTSPDALAATLFPKALMFALGNMLGMTALGLYQQDQFRGRIGYAYILSRVLVSLMLVFLALMILFYLVPFFQLGRGITLLAFLVSLVLVVAIRRLFVLYLGADLVTSKVLVYGVGRNAASLLIKDDGNLPTSSYRIVGFISTPEQNRYVPDEKVIEIGDSLLHLAHRYDAHEIVIALDDRNENYPVQYLLDCKLAGINVTDPISFLEREQGKVNLSHLNPSWMVFSDGFRGSRIKSALSRAFDVVSSLLILVVTAPILALVAFLIALEGGFREPVLYRQQRVGKNGQVFDLLKFRSMRVDAEKNGAQWAGQNDARVTRVGSIIRKLRIDELPQIVNILKGDMRLVGPRPERPEFVAQLSQTIDYYQQRHSVKPGLAGWAQLKYPYGASEKDAYEKLQYDLYYIKNANPVMDFFILLQTLEVVIFGKGVR
ncbi:MAG: TIGR03013 family PEP-CTERM/XrtA system glycosyltransferase [Gammaproteobacteria bacterium]|nr:TIGR03013 family PEP-CTERM/XrtA system glycosyltransferase [Pseudomonadales bacterium]MCP5346866.1 TIGR03013 family PEP-CTERM/XrtA system glycosyltransferase [Pseudomonadales bacterium]